MVKKLFVLVVATLALGACAPSAPPAPDTAADEAAVRAVSARWFELLAKGDLDGVANLYTEDTVVLPDKAPTVIGRAAFRDFLTGMAAELSAGGLTLKDGPTATVGVSGDLAWISGTYTLVDGAGTVLDTGKYLSLHRRGTGDWLYERDIWNSDQAPAQAPEAGKGG